MWVKLLRLKDLVSQACGGMGNFCYRLKVSLHSIGALMSGALIGVGLVILCDYITHGEFHIYRHWLEGIEGAYCE